MHYDGMSDGPRIMRGWQDDFETAADRRALWRAARDIREHRAALQAMAPPEVRYPVAADEGLCGCGCQQAGTDTSTASSYRHRGTDDAAHHWSTVTRLRCPCGCADADAAPGSLLLPDADDVTGREIDALIRAREQADIESTRVRFSARFE